MFTLEEVATLLGPSFGVERLGGNVYAATDFSITVSINGGQLAASPEEAEDGWADLLVCDSWSGVELIRATIKTAAEAATVALAVAP